jgi:hypothetical protein
MPKLRSIAMSKISFSTAGSCFGGMTTASMSPVDSRPLSSYPPHGGSRSIFVDKTASLQSWRG